MGTKAAVGDLIPGRVQVLTTEKWMSFEALTSVGVKSAAYNEKDRAGIFYAESWALVHMLYLAPEYSPKFGAFVAAIHSGKTAAEACEIACGRTSAQVYADLQAYLKRNRLFGAVFDVKLTKAEEESEASQPSAFESGTMLADLLGIVGKHDRAAEAFRKLAAENPDRPEIPQYMGYLAWQSNDRDGARKQFEKSFATGGKDPEMCFHMAMLELENNPSSDIAIAALKRALEVKPDYTDARLHLGLAHLNAGRYAEGLAALQQIHRINDEQAATLFNALAFGYVRTGNREEARKQAQTALKWDRTEDERQRTQNILAYLDAAPDPPKNPFAQPD